jgi:tripartite-type tricarboxylate transporter receptor subunit TctC
MKQWLVAAGIGVAAWAGAAVAQTSYPNRPIRLIVPWAPGGNVDITARLIGAPLSEILGQPIVVDNRPGAGGTLGGNLVAKAAPDGYTLLMGSSGSLTVSAAVFSKMPYDPARDFAPIGMVHEVPLVIALGPKTPARSVKDLVALAKAQPGKITAASAGTGSSNHLVIEMFNARAGVALNHVPYKGSGPALVDAVGGQVALIVDQLNSSLPYIQDKRLHAVAVTTLKRSSLLPEVPTLDESGLREFEATTFTGVLATAGTPKPVIDKLYAALARTLDSPPVVERIRGMAAERRKTTPQEFAAFMKNDLQRWKEVARTANVRID